MAVHFEIKKMLDEIVSTANADNRAELLEALKSCIKDCDRLVIKRTMLLIGRSKADIEAVKILAECLNNARKIIKALDAIFVTWSSDEKEIDADTEKLRIFLNNDRIKGKLFENKGFKNTSNEAGIGLLRFLKTQSERVNSKYKNYNWFPVEIKGEDDSMSDVEKVLFAATNAPPAALKRVMDSVPLRAIKRASDKANNEQKENMRAVANKNQLPLI